LTNEAEGAATAIHWHGIRQLNTQYMDGAPYVTQCPIPFGEKFRYAFHADDEGTHFYHSHAGHQKANGIYGALIVRSHEHNRNKKLYDFDMPSHLIIVTDWMHHLAEEDFPGMISRSVLTESILINGHGRYYNVRTPRNIPKIIIKILISHFRKHLSHMSSRRGQFTTFKGATAIASDSSTQDLTFALFCFKFKITI
jgi:FtsP/CotA-like multicopper oxidase with cupredoxin domain